MAWYRLANAARSRRAQAASRAAGAVQHPPQHEQQIREAVQVHARPLQGGLVPGHGHERALRAPADGAGEVGKRRGAGAAGQDEFLEGREVRVEGGHRRLEALDVRVAHHRVAGDGEFAPEVEKVVLNAVEQVADRVGHRLGEQDAEGGVELVDVAQGGDPRAVLGDARAVREAGLSLVAGPGGDPGEPVAHGVRPVTVPCGGRTIAPGTRAAGRKKAPGAPGPEGKDGLEEPPTALTALGRRRMRRASALAVAAYCQQRPAWDDPPRRNERTEMHATLHLLRQTDFPDLARRPGATSRACTATSTPARRGPR